MALLFFPVEETPFDPGGGPPGFPSQVPTGPLASMEEVPMDPRWRSTWTPAGGSPSPTGHPGGSSSGPSNDLRFQGPPRHLFTWQSSSALDQSMVDMNRSVMQLFTA